MITHFVSKSTIGEVCRICGEQATHKVGEEISHDEPNPQFPGRTDIKVGRHNFTAYVCCKHFRFILGDSVFCPLLISSSQER